jgi:hypothetical protein
MQYIATRNGYSFMIIRKKYSKYHNKKTTIDGLEFDSKKEADYYSHLLILKAAKLVRDIKHQVEFILQDKFNKNNVHYRSISYIADFVVTYSDGHIEIIDVKGVKTEVYKIKKKLFEFKYPDLTIIEK